MASTSLTVTLASAPTSGHLLLVLAANIKSFPVAAPGWTQVYLGYSYGAPPFVSVWYRIAQPGDSATQTVANFLNPSNFTSIGYEISGFGNAPYFLDAYAASPYPGDSFTISQTAAVNNTIAFYVAGNTQGNSQTLTLSNANFVQDLNYANQTSEGNFNTFAGHSVAPYSAGSLIASTFTIAPSGEVEPFFGILVLLATNVANVIRPYTPSDTVTINDAIYRTFFRNVNESLTINDLVSFNYIRPRTAQEALIWIDQLSENRNLPRPATEIISGGDFVLKSAIQPRPVSEAITPSDLLHLTLGPVVSESLTVSDNASNQQMLARSASDSTAPSDSVVRTLNARLTALESLAPNDSIARLLKAVRQSMDSLGWSDSVTKTASHPRSTDESLLLSDFLTAIKSAYQTATDSELINDATRMNPVVIRNASEMYPFTDAVLKKIAATENLTDDIQLSDFVNKAISALKSAQDTILLNDAVVSLHPLIRTATELLPLNDSLHKTQETELREFIRILDSVMADFLFTSYAIQLLGIAPPTGFAGVTSILEFPVSLTPEIDFQAVGAEEINFNAPMKTQRGT